MHAVLAFTYSHDRLLKPIPEKAGATELFHNYKGAALFNYRLNGDVTPSERDAIVSHNSSHNLNLFNLIISLAWRCSMLLRLRILKITDLHLLSG